MGLLSELPIVQAPMAGGPSTPALAAAVAAAGGYAFVAGGYLSVDGLREAVATTRRLSPAPFGVNLFVPSEPGDPEQVAAYAVELQPDAERLGVDLGEPRWEDDSYDAKLDVVAATHVDLVSFTFGCPSADIIERLHRADVKVAVCVTSVLEAQLAVAAGTDLLVVQGSEAGGHQACFANLAANERPLLSVLGEIRDSGGHVPMIGTGGIMTGRDAAAVLHAGAIAVQIGTARCSVRRRRGRPPRTARRCWTSATPRRSSPAPTADDSLVGWQTNSPSTTTARPRRPTRRCTTSPSRFAAPPPGPATPACPTSGPAPVGAT